MKDKLDQSMLGQIVRATNEKKNIFGAVFYVSSEDKSIDLLSASGNFEPESPYYIASINKLFISSILLKLYADNQLDVNDKISRYIPEEVMQELHIYNGTWIQLPSATVKGVYVEKNTSYGVRKPSVFLGR